MRQVVKVDKSQEWIMSNFLNRLTQWLVGDDTEKTRQPLVAWEASWDEAEALMASGKLWNHTAEAEPQRSEVSLAHLSRRGG